MKSAAIILCLAVCLWLTDRAYADDPQGQRVVKGAVYKYKDSSGVIHYTNVGCPPESECLGVLFTYTERAGALWTRFFDSSAGRHLVRKGQVERDGDQASDWVLLNFLEPYGIAPGRVAKSRMEYWTANCTTKLIQIRDTVLYSGPDGTGEVVSMYNAATGFQRAVPGSLGEAALKHLCRINESPPGAA